MNPLAETLNRDIQKAAPSVFEMLSDLGREFYYPKGILTQTAEAKQKAHRYNATIGMATEAGTAMTLPSVMRHCDSLSPLEALTYAPSAGQPELRAKWKEQLLVKNPSFRSDEASLPVVTGGVTHGLSLAAELFVNQGDVVAVPQLFWGNYNMIFGVRLGADIQTYPLFGTGGGLDIPGMRCALERASGRGKLVLLLNFPNNPTGYSPTEIEVDQICETVRSIAEQHCPVVVLCDDAYFGLAYDPDAFQESIFARLTSLHRNVLAVKLDGATKEDYVWGFRVGFITFAHTSHDTHLYEALEKKTAGAIRGNVSSCSHISQSILLKAMQDEHYSAEKEQNRCTLQRRAAKVKEVLADDRFATAWSPYPFNSGYFMCLKLRNLKAEAFRLRLLDKYGIGVIAVNDSDIRVAFSSVEEDEIPDLFEQMFLCASTMINETAGSV